MARRSTDSAGLSVGAPCTWQRKPSLAYSSAREMPDLASRSDARTSWVLLPMDETMPMPVTTTRLIPTNLYPCCFAIGPHMARSVQSCKTPRRLGAAWRQRGSGPARLQHLVLLEQADLEVARAVNNGAVRRQPAVGNAKHQLGAHHTLHVDAVNDLLHVRQHLAGKLQFAEAERAAFAGRTEPTEEKADQLPKRVEPEAARHHRIALEVAQEKPEVRLHVELGADHALAVRAAGFGNFRDAVEHQHRRQRQLRIAGAEQLAAAASQQVLVLETVSPLVHRHNIPHTG